MAITLEYRVQPRVRVREDLAVDAEAVPYESSAENLFSVRAPRPNLGLVYMLHPNLTTAIISAAAIAASVYASLTLISGR
jgi:hypothetical protein